jgi:3-oxoacyl-[acyl-carrier protein] reductase
MGQDAGVLEGKVALVTGSSRGIGRAIATAFAKHGASVALHGRDAKALEEVRTQVTQTSARAIVVRGDVTKWSDVEAIRAAVESGLGPLDILVANAGASLTMPAPLEEITEDSWRATVDANLTATFLTLKSFIPGMKARRSGVIITMASAAARKPHPKAPIPYGAAKAGIQTLTQDVAGQLGPFNIRVNCIAPETILTERNASRIPEAQQRDMAAAHPIPRLGTPEDVAHAALYLASPQASWITGVVLDVAGGAVMV